MQYLMKKWIKIEYDINPDIKIFNTLKKENKLSSCLFGIVCVRNFYFQCFYDIVSGWTNGCVFDG